MTYSRDRKEAVGTYAQDRKAERTTTIDITPTWEQIVPALLEILKSGNTESKQFAVAEITRMAKLADRHLATLQAN